MSKYVLEVSVIGRFITIVFMGFTNNNTYITRKVISVHYVIQYEFHKGS